VWGHEAGTSSEDIGRLSDVVALGVLQHLDLSDNALNNKSTGQLAQCLANPDSALRSLVLSGNNRMTTEGLRVLLQALRKPSVLSSLSLDGTGLDDQGVNALAEVLEGNTVLELNISDTKVSNAEARRLLRLAPSTGLQRLVLDDGGERVRWRRLNTLDHAHCGDCVSSLLALRLQAAGVGIPLSPTVRPPYF